MASAAFFADYNRAMFLQAIASISFLLLSSDQWVMAILTAVYVAFTGAYVVIALLTLKAIERQAKLTEEQGESNAEQFSQQLAAMDEARKQTEELIKQATAQAAALTQQASAAETAAQAATSAAQAALLNAEGVMKAERAWILLKKIVADKVSPREKAWCIIHFRNSGNTPGRFVSFNIELQIGDKDTEPPNPQAVFGNIEEASFSHVLTPKAIFPIIANLAPDPFLTSELHDELLAHKAKFLWLCGMVKYRDVFEEVSEPHETRFCYLYKTLEGSNKFFWIPYGPREYNQAT